MNSKNLNSYLSVGISAVLNAAKICRNVQLKLTDEFHQKKDKSPVTIADYASQAVICHALHVAFKEIPIIGEEDSQELRQPQNDQLRRQALSEIREVGIKLEDHELAEWIDEGGSKSYSSMFWTLDPIDGTKGFLRKDQYAISLALIVDGQITIGILACPNLHGGQILTAIKGEGAYLASLSDVNSRTLINVSSVKEFSQARFCESFESGHSAHDESARLFEKLGVQVEPLRMDSQAKYAMLAQGLAEVYLRLPTRKDYHEKIWDHAGGVLVVEEAGGKVTDLDGRPLNFALGHELRENRGVVVTNGHLHHQLLNQLSCTMK